MSEHDDPVVRRYRELRREVPSAALDVKVLAAARSAVAPRSLARRWAAPLAAAAVLVIAVGVTMHLQREEGKRAGEVPEQAAAPATAAKMPAELASPTPTSALASPRASASASTPSPSSAAREIPFAPRRPIEPMAGGGPGTASGALGKGARGSEADLARAQREAAAAVASFGAASGASASGQAGPFSVDQATSAGVQVKLVQPR